MNLTPTTEAMIADVQDEKGEGGWAAGEWSVKRKADTPVRKRRNTASRCQ